jgi:hypothetical protein
VSKLTTKQQKDLAWFRYLYKDITYLHATALKGTMLKNNIATKESEQFVKVVNYVKQKKFIS